MFALCVATKLTKQSRRSYPRVTQREPRCGSGREPGQKHQKQQQTGGGKTIPSGIREFEAPIHASNVMVVDSITERASRRVRRGKAAEEAKPATKRATAKKETVAAEPKAKATEAKKSATPKTAKADEGAGK